MSDRYLVDTSAFMRLSRHPWLRAAWADSMKAGLLAVCPLTELEIFYSAQSTEDRQELAQILNDFYVLETISDRAFDRALDVQTSLTAAGMHRSAGPVDLVVAATAEQQRRTVLHYDRDFEKVAELTGQATRWVVDPGTVS